MASEFGWETIGGTKMSFDLTTTFGVPPFSHHAAAQRNMSLKWPMY